jgi:raffinose/stachyose/melibiose transport system substrate-binding protein
MRKGFLGILLIGVLIVTGCGKSEKAASPSGGGKTDLVFMTIFPETENEADTSILAKYAQIKKFIADHPDVNFINNSISQTDYNTKIKAIMASDQLPDVWSVRGAMGIPAIDAGRVYEMDEILSTIPGWKESFDGSAFDDFMYKGQFWAVPVQIQGTTYLFSNMNMLKSIGINKAPETWDELKAAIVASKNKGWIPLCVGNKDKYPIADCIGSWLNDRYVTTAWFTSIRERQGARFTDKPFVDALKAFDELVKLGAFNLDANSLDQTQGQAYYARQESPMFFSGAWGSEWVEVDCSPEIRDATVVTLPPSIPGTPGAQNGAAGGGGWGYAISKPLAGEKFKAAVDLVYYLTNDDYTRESLKLGYGRYPAKPPADADFSKIGPVMKQYLDTIPKCVWTPDYTVLIEPSTLEVYQNVYQELMVGTTTPEQGAKKIDAAYQMYLETSE